MSEPKKKSSKRPTKYEKPVKVDATFNELINLAMEGKGYKSQKKKEK
jgi:hypothetical protein